jgi:hypothetical protein
MDGYVLAVVAACRFPEGFDTSAFDSVLRKTILVNLH